MKSGDKIDACKVKRRLRDKDDKDHRTSRWANGPERARAAVPGGTGRRPALPRLMYGGQRRERAGQAGPGRLRVRRRLQDPTDGGETWTRINSLNPRPMYFSQIRVDPSDDKYHLRPRHRPTIAPRTAARRSRPTAASASTRSACPVDRSARRPAHDPRRRRRLLRHLRPHGHTGTSSTTWPSASSITSPWTAGSPYRVYGGLQDNGSWGGPSLGLHGGIGPINEDWIVVGGGDGFVCRVDPQDPDLVYFERRTAAWAAATCAPASRRSDRPAGAAGRQLNRIASTGTRRSSCPATIRGSSTAAATIVFRSVEQAATICRSISPEITATKRGTASALAESPRNPDVLWVGTDDGYLWVTRDGGRKWTNVRRQGRPAGPALGGQHRAVALRRGPGLRLSSTPIAPTTTRPTCIVTEDFGKTWKSLRGNLPTRLDARAARGHREPESAVLRHRVRRLGVARSRRSRGRSINNNSADRGGPRVRPASDGRRDRGGDAWPQPVDSGRDAAAADDGREQPGGGGPVSTGNGDVLAARSRSVSRSTATAAGALWARTRRVGADLITHWARKRRR